MSHPPLNEKEKFQLDRIALFSDAIFAIAITLLIIEIKVPELHSEPITDTALAHELAHLMPKFIGFLVSFLVIGLYWLAHHRMFRFVTRSSQKLLWNNLLFMLPIVLMPFSTSFFSEYYSDSLRLPLLIYTVNILLAGLFSFRLWRIVYLPQNKLSVELSPVLFRFNATRALIIPCFFLAAILLSYINITLAYAIPPLAPLAGKFINWYYVKKYPNEMKKHLS
ncbi:MAG TPA: TMEM175 family protein [Ferruginibacter sp.]|nr:TMEM175 family protein [Ferruginibacter sp.]